MLNFLDDCHRDTGECTVLSSGKGNTGSQDVSSLVRKSLLNKLLGFFGLTGNTRSIQFCTPETRHYIYSTTCLSTLEIGLEV